jgi:hypothetical protein
MREAPEAKSERGVRKKKNPAEHMRKMRNHDTKRWYD